MGQVIDEHKYTKNDDTLKLDVLLEKVRPTVTYIYAIFGCLSLINTKFEFESTLTAQLNIF